jgi:peptide/nickel transport system ATP-binding protein
LREAAIPSASSVTKPLLEVQGLVKHFRTRAGISRGRVTVRAVDGISFSIDDGETLGIVGESGCGKSTTSRLLMGLIEPDAGRLLYEGVRVGSRALPIRDFRRSAQMVFQNSYASLNPRLSVAGNIAFGLSVNGLRRAEAARRTADVLTRVGLPPTQFMDRYPHELSGGQRQRVNIARALALNPRIVILDEPVSALDQSVQAQVLNLLTDLRREAALTFVFISHDLNIVRYISDRVLVMYLGKIVEIAPVEEIYGDPRHPYTRALLSAMPSRDPARRTEKAALTGDPPSSITPPSGCRFRTRCAFHEPVCASLEPQLRTADGGARASACHMEDPLSGHSKASRS